MFQEDIDFINLHTFYDATVVGISCALYAVVKQKSGVTEGLAVAETKLAKQGLTIPLLELVSAHMAANLVRNTQETLDRLPGEELARMAELYCGSQLDKGH